MGWLSRITGRDAAAAQAALIERQTAVIGKLVRARYDAAQTTDINKRHWAMADGYSADAALSPEIRRKLRNRARLERDNNPYLAGMVQTLASDLVGTGPRLALTVPGEASADVVGRVEEAVYEWGQRIDLPRKLRIAKMAKAVDGESVGVLFTNRRLNRRGVQLDLRLVEADQLASPVPSIDPAAIDGLQLDADGNVARYWILRHHPGATMAGWSIDGDWYDAEDVVHWFHAVRPGQHRGVGEVVPALEQFAHLRRYTLAVITAAETAADFAAILKTTLPPEGVAAALEAWETMPISRGMATSIPDGWDAVQMKAEHPTSTFADFEKRMLTAIARSMNLPYIVAAMDSSAASYSSMRGDYLVYRKAIGCERADLERVVLDPILERWLDEAALVPGLIPDGLPPVSEWGWSWTWDGFEHVDPAKEQNALETALRTHTTTLQREYAKRNLDWRRELRQRAVEIAEMDDLGLLVDILPEESSQETKSGELDQ
jgi:lambda family phage portal protein